MEKTIRVINEMEKAGLLDAILVKHGLKGQFDGFKEQYHGD